VRRALDAALATATGQKSRDENLAALRTVAHDFLDTKTMGRRAIGEVLSAQPPAQQAEYLDLAVRQAVGRFGWLRPGGRRGGGHECVVYAGVEHAKPADGRA